MNNVTKIVLVIVATVVVVAIGAFTYSNINASQKQSSSESSTLNNLPAMPETSSDTRTASHASKPTTENPADQGDVVAQPAYLVSAYTRHEKNYIGVDYVMVFKGTEAVEAMVEDGLCVTASECQVDPEGYIRNNNPHFRTYELSTTTPVAIEASGAIRDKALQLGLNASNLTFEDLKNILPEMPPYVQSKQPFKEAKSFVYLDIFGQGVTKIREP